MFHPTSVKPAVNISHVRANQNAATARRFPHVIVLNRHPDHPPGKNGDPRKLWLYEGRMTGKWRVEPVGYVTPWSSPDQFEYMFENELDALMFELRWMNYE